MPSSSRPKGSGSKSRPRHGKGSLRSPDRKSTRLNSSHLGISYAVFCLKKKKKHQKTKTATLPTPKHTTEQQRPLTPLKTHDNNQNTNYHHLPDHAEQPYAPDLTTQCRH